MNDTITREYLLLEYLFISRRQQEQFTSIINSYSSTMSSLNSNIRMLLQRYIENESNYMNNLMSYRQNITNRPPTISNVRTRVNNLSPLQTRPRRNAFSWTTTLNRPTQNRHSERINVANTLGNTFANTLGNTIGNILQTTLHTPSRTNPLSNVDISNNTTIRIRSEIECSQEVCPISLTRFLPSDRVMQINTCGHIFLESSLTRFLQNFDNRCPLCRIVIASSSATTARPLPNLNNDRPLPNVETTPRSSPHSSSWTSSYSHRRRPPLPHPVPSPLHTLPLQPPTPSALSTDPNQSSSTSTYSSSSLLPNQNRSAFDGSFNYISNLEPSDNTQPELNNLINSLSATILSSLTSAIQNPDNSGNAISAEYSLVFPRNNN